MKLNMSLRSEFEELYERFASDEQLCKLLDIEGISPRKLDVGLASYDFFNSKLADIATDANSNATENISPTSYRTFIADNQMKLLGYHMLWHFTEKRFGRKFADKAISMIWDGSLYFHDAHGVKIQMPYCFAFSLDHMVMGGRPYGPSPNTPPKHRKSFISQLDKLISDMSKQFAGATAPSDFLLWYAYFCKKDGLDPNNEQHKKEIINDFQGLVCLFNEPSRAEGESPFTNIALYDTPGLESLFGHIFYPDGKKADLEYIMELQKIFAEWFSQGDPISGFPYRFPVVTMNLTTDDRNEFIDKDTADWMARVNRNMANFNIHFGSRSKLAMCCYSDDTEVLTNEGWKLFKDITGQELFATVNIDTKNIEYQQATNHISYQYNGIMHHYRDNKRMFDMMVTPNHEMLCVGGTGTGKRNKWKFVKSEDLGTSQALIRRTELFDGNCDEFAKLVGFYLGDGYYDTNRDVVSFNLKKERKIDYLLGILRSLGIKYNIKNRDSNGMTRIDVFDDKLLGIAQRIGKSDSKYIPYDMNEISMEFASGLLDGLMNSDGNWDSNRFWTTSDRLRDDVMHIACILGYQPWYMQHDRITELRGKEYQNNIYEIKLLTVEMLTHAKSRREEIEYDGMVYCVDVPNHTLFVRRNGVASLSSNCRYENDLDDMDMSPDSFGNGGVNIGSHRVITINLPRAIKLAIQEGKDIYYYVDKYMDVASKLLMVHRYDILENRIKKNPDYLQFFGRLGWFSLDTMFSTFGITGIYEACKFAGHDILSDEGTNFVLDLLSRIKSNVKGYRNTYGVAFNIEEIPGEQACVSIINKDKIFIDPNIEEKLYSNQYIPLIVEADILTRIDLSGRFMKLVSGGGIVHLNVDAKIDSDGKMYELFRLAAKSGITHMAICHRFGKCENGHTSIVAQSDNCPVCDAPIVSARNRVIGFYSDENNWNPIRRKYDARLRYFSGVEEDADE